MQVNIRQAELSDSDVICEMMKKLAEFEKIDGKFSATPNSVKEMMSEANGLSGVIAEADNKAVGMAVYNFYRLATFSGKRVMYIEDIFIDESCRGTGVGTALFKEIVSIAKKLDCIKIEWKCLDWNTSAQAFYKKMGGVSDGGWLTYTLDLRE